MTPSEYIEQLFNIKLLSYQKKYIDKILNEEEILILKNKSSNSFFEETMKGLLEAIVIKNEERDKK